MRYKGFSKRVFAPFVFLLLTSCGWHHDAVQSKDKATVPYKVAGTSDEHQLQMHKRLVEQGAQVITIGQNYLISIPSTALFRKESPRINWHSYALLNDVACYLKQFQKVSVNIDSYTGKCVSPHRDRALTLARSRAVADYLWSQDIGSRFIFTHGLGSDKPIVAHHLKGDASPNSRVEITFHNEVA